jgi:hypothetical protein
MDDETVGRVLKGIAKLMVRMESDLLKMQASVTVLQITVAALAGEEPTTFLARLRESEQKALAGVPVSRQLQELTELMNVLDEHGKSFGKNEA